MVLVKVLVDVSILVGFFIWLRGKLEAKGSLKRVFKTRCKCVFDENGNEVVMLWFHPLGHFERCDDC